MSRSPREVVEQVGRMVAGEGIVFADLFAADGVLAYPFAPPGMPRETSFCTHTLRDDAVLVVPDARQLPLEELPDGANAVAFSTGFVIATGLLHLAGIAFSLLTRWPAGRIAVRGAGAMIALVGVAYLGALA